MAKLLWVVKTAESESLSHSRGKERIGILKHAQRRTRQHLVSRSDSALQGYKQRMLLDAGFKVQQSMLCSQPTLTSEWTPEERRSVALFERIAIHKIITLQRDLSFWTCTVPYLVRNHTAFRHIVVAIAATFELVSVGGSVRTNVFALEQCNKATEELKIWTSISPAHIMVSCILIAAYNLLRSDLDQVDKIVESGLKIAEARSDTDKLQPDPTESAFALMLFHLGRQFGFKLWVPGICFEFDKLSAARDPLVIEFEHAKGPFFKVEQALNEFKSLMISLVAKLMRNLARGAYIPPTCLLAQDALSEFHRAFYFCDKLSGTLDNSEDRIGLVQIKIGLYSAYIHLLTKVLNSDERSYDRQIPLYKSMLRLAEQIRTAREDGYRAIYIDRIVNGSIFTLAICCREPYTRRQAIKFLRNQIMHEQGMKNYLLGTVAETITKIEEANKIVTTCNDVPIERRIHLLGLTCRASDKYVGVSYMSATAPDRSKPMQVWLPCPQLLQDREAQDIDETLIGIQTTYTMYMRADQCQAPQGFIRPMFYLGRQVPVCWQS